MRILNAIEIYEARALMDAILRQRRAGRAARAAVARGDGDAAGRYTVEVVLLRRRLGRLGTRAA